MKAIDSCPIGKWKWTLYIKKCLFISPVEASTTLQTQHKHTSPFSSLLLVHIHLIVLYRFHVCKGVFILVYFIWITVPMKSPPVDLPKRGGRTQDYHCKLLPHTLIPSTCRARGQTRLDVEKETILLGPEHAHTYIHLYMCGREFLGLRLWLWMAWASSPTKKTLTPQAMCFQNSTTM